MSTDSNNWPSTPYSTIALTNGQAQSASYTPSIAGTYYFKAVYSGDTNYVGSSSGSIDEQLNVCPHGTSIMTNLGVDSKSIVFGQSVQDNATVSGMVGSTAMTGSVSFYVSTDSNNWPSTPYSTIALTNGQAQSASYTPSIAGTYYFKAVYSGDTNYIGSSSGSIDEQLNVCPHGTSIMTNLGVDSKSIVFGQSVQDNATVSGMVGSTAMTGSVSFYVSTDSNNWPSTPYSTIALTNGQAQSASYTPSIAGTYYFKAVYSGDTNYIGSSSGSIDEQLNVCPHGTSIMTNLGVDSKSIVFGQSVQDNATVSGMVGSTAMTGSVSFYVSTDSNNWPSTPYSTIALTNGQAQSASYTPSIAGTYYFKAVYSGDTNYIGSSSGSIDEQLNVCPHGTSIMTNLGVDSKSIVFGQSVQDNATVSGMVGSTAMTGSVSFYVSTDSNNWPSTPYSTIALTNGQAQSASYTPSIAGTYYFKAVYSGDTNYAGSSSGALDEMLTVMGTHCGCGTIITLGQSVTDNATVTGLGSPFPVPSGYVLFEYSADGGVTFTQYGNPVELDANGHAQSDWFMPLETGRYYLRAVYLGDDNYLGSSSGPLDEPLCVMKAASTTTTQLMNDDQNVLTITFGQSVTDTVKVSGIGSPFPVPTGTVDFMYSNDGGNSWTTYDASVKLDSNGQAVSSIFQPTATGNYDFKAVYSGDKNYTKSCSGQTDEPLNVHKGLTGPQVTTNLGIESEMILLGHSVQDNATVTPMGAPFMGPTGTVDFQYSIDGGNHWTSYSVVSLDANGNAVSALFQPKVAGNYLFKAIYSGDDNYAGSTSDITSEPLTVYPNTTTTTTNIGIASETIILGQSVQDNATVSVLGAPFPAPTGTVTFSWSTDSVNWNAFSTVNINADGTAISGLFQPLAAGQYYFMAAYSGDSNYVGSSSTPCSEPLLVRPHSTTTTTDLKIRSETIILGQSVQDNATVSLLGTSFPASTGTVEFQWSKDAKTWTTYSTVNINADGTAISGLFQPLVAGQYYFMAVYSGDSNYVGSSSTPCSEPLLVRPHSTTTTTNLGIDSETIILGQSVQDNATVSLLGAPFPASTGTVTFSWTIDGVNWNAYSTVNINADGTAISGLFQPLVAGQYYFMAVYSGDKNYTGSPSCPCSEPLLVCPHSTTITTQMNIESEQIVLGQSVQDNATVSLLGAPFPAPTGTVTFQYSTDNGANWHTYSTVSINSDGTATSGFFLPLAAGNYEFRAVYSGDKNYVGSPSNLGDEPLLVNKAPTGTTTSIIGCGYTTPVLD